MALADKNLAILWAKPCPLQLNDDPERRFRSSFFLALASSPRAPSSILLCSSCILLPAPVGPVLWALVPALFVLFPCPVCPPLSPSAKLLTLLSRLLQGSSAKSFLTSIHRQLWSLPKNSTVSRMFLALTQYPPFLCVISGHLIELGAWCVLPRIPAATTWGSIHISTDEDTGSEKWRTGPGSHRLMVEPGLTLGLCDSNLQSSFAGLNWMTQPGGGCRSG